MTAAPGSSEATQRAAEIAARRATGLACWSGEVMPEPLPGGLTNQNFVVRDRGESFVVRIADDIPVHGIMRFNELASSRAAHAAGVSPEIVHAEPGALVMRFIEGTTYGEAEVRAALAAGRIVPLLKKVHHGIPKHFEGPALIFWVFQVARGYAQTLRAGGSRMTGELPRYLEINAELEAALGPVEIVFGHQQLPATHPDDTPLDGLGLGRVGHQIEHQGITGVSRVDYRRYGPLSPLLGLLQAVEAVHQLPAVTVFDHHNRLELAQGVQGPLELLLEPPLQSQRV